MTERPGVLRVGDRVLFGGGEHQVVALAGNAVRLLAVSGQAMVVALPFLLAAPDFAIVGTGTAAAGLAPRPAPQGLLDVLPEHVAGAARDWERHLIEVLTGLPPDAPDGAAPRPEYDPARPLAEREQAKAAEPAVAAGVAQACVSAAAALLTARPAGLHLLLEVATRASAAAGVPELPGSITDLAAGTNGSKLAEAARRLARARDVALRA